jgi:hypothetical protein
LGDLGDLTATSRRVADVLEIDIDIRVPKSPTLSTQQTKSMKLVIERERDWMTKRQMALLVDVFEKEPFAAESYQIVLEDNELCREWIRVKINAHARSLELIKHPRET